MLWRHRLERGELRGDDLHESIETLHRENGIHHFAALHRAHEMIHLV